MEHAADNTMLRNFKICDDCAASVIREVTKELNASGTTIPAEKPDISLTALGLVDTISLAKDNILEITLSMDLAKARKVVLKQTEAADAEKLIQESK